MDFSKKYGALRGATNVIDLGDGAQIEVNARGSRASNLGLVEGLDEKLTRALEKDPETRTAAENLKIACAMVASRIVSWKGIFDDGEEVPFTRAKAIEYCYAYPEFRALLNAEYAKLEAAENDKAEVQEAIKKK